MRGQTGYAGPVVHWWRDCLLFCGPAHDWRYEGIIAGYLTLFERTGQSCWLEKARAAGDDLLRAQLADGRFLNSCFESNPRSGGTPHEAAADVGLLLLAKALRERGDDSWQHYLRAGRRNVEGFYLQRLWCETEQVFRDNPSQPTFVPNKSATLIEAFCLLADLRGREEYLQRYVRPTADAILAHQVRARGSVVDGAIAQNSLGRSLIEKYFPYYNARCVAGLIAASQFLGDERYVEAAAAAMRFVWRWRDSDGAFPQVVYGSGRTNRYPRWIAAVGDILRAADLLRPYGLDFPEEPTLTWLLEGQLPSGGFATAHGFAAQVSQVLPTGGREFRDWLPVCGWTDKAFRFLAGRVNEPSISEQVGTSWTLGCSFKGLRLQLTENERAISLRHPDRPLYTWIKGADWAEIDGLAVAA